MSTVCSSEGIKVLTTDQDQELPDRFGQAELVNSSLHGLPEISICVRFKTFQFSTYLSPWYSQSVLTYGDTTPLYSYVATDCEEKFPGCTLRYKKWVKNWAHGRPFGYFWENSMSYGYYPSWQPAIWNHACITATDSSGYLDININGKSVYRTNNYMKSFSRLDHNLVLMNDGGFWDGFPMHGSMTDLQVWSRVLSREEVVGWSFCNTSLTGDVLNWETVSWKSEKLEIVELDKEEICMREEGPVFKAFKTEKNFDETLHFCRTINGAMAVAEDKQKYLSMNQSFLETCKTSTDFFTGYTDSIQDEVWLDGNSGAVAEMADWADGFPTNYYQYDCSYTAPGYKVRDYVCSDRTCPICQVRPTDFTLRGVCLDSTVDKFYFTERFDYFLGYTSSRLVFSEDNSRWEIVNNTNTSQLLAFMESGVRFPLGLHQWYFLASNCTDPGTENRSLNFHLNVQQPGSFCCQDGHCIPSRFVCNNLPDCREEEDEKNCSFLFFDKFGYDPKRPPIDYRNGQVKLPNLEATFTVIQILDINEGDSIFDLHFQLQIQWFDKTVQFDFLKDQELENSLSEDLSKHIWSPRVKFYDEVSTINTYSRELFVTKLSKPVLNGEIDVLNVREVYHGRENPFNLLTEKRIKFTCLFDNIKFYPFGSQICSLKFYLEGADSNLTNILPREIINRGQKEFGQYVIKSWTMEADFTERKYIRVSMVLSRNIGSILMVTYLPTILMNLANQATNYIRSDDKYSLVYTINITCMMVLSSVYLSVSASLPATSDIKPVEIWLLFNLAFPFFVMKSNIIQQVEYSTVIYTTTFYLGY